MEGISVVNIKLLKQIACFYSSIFQMLRRLTKLIYASIIRQPKTIVKYQEKLYGNIALFQGDRNLIKPGCNKKIQKDVLFACSIPNYINTKFNVNQLRNKMTLQMNSNYISKLNINPSFCYFWIGYSAMDRQYHCDSNFPHSSSSPFTLVPCDIIDTSSKASKNYGYTYDDTTNAKINAEHNSLKDFQESLTRNRCVSECSEDSYICFRNDSDVGDKSADLSFDETLSDDEILFQDENEASFEKNLNIESEKSEKKVHFNLTPQIHIMRTWNFAYRNARKGEWEIYARDRARFQQRIARAGVLLNPILSPEHRRRVFVDRFVKNTVT